MDDDDDLLGSRITKHEDLPEWFDPEKYKSAVHLDARGWEEQLDVRRICYEEFWQGDLGVDVAETDHFGFKLEELLEAVRETPIYPFYESTYYEGVTRTYGVPNRPYRPENSIAPGLTAISAHDVINLVHGLPLEKQHKIIELLSENIEQSSRGRFHALAATHEIDWISEPLEASHQRVIAVNGYLPNRLLLESFEKYLATTDVEIPEYFKGRPLRSNTFLEWCNCGLLQYIDLEIWCAETGSRITNKALANGMFPNSSEKGEENIRTTTRKHANSILHDGVVFSALHAYAEQEEMDNQSKIEPK